MNFRKISILFKTFLKINIFIITFFIFGCTSSTIISLANITSKINIDKRDVKTKLNDLSIELKISNSISEQFFFEKYRILTIVYNNKILLIGQSPGYIADKAKIVALNIDNEIREVYNEIRNCNPITLLQILKDCLTTAKIKIFLIINSKIDDSRIKIITENNEVFLLGMLNCNEAELVSYYVSKINGIKKIITLYTYTN